MPVPSVLIRSLPTVVKSRVKKYVELRYWRRRHADEGTLAHDHYAYFYTTHFGMTAEDYRDKRVLDIGCGPRGSLEWAGMAARRVGLDPLADQYLKLGAADHKMEYVAAPSEAIPFADGYFDVVCSFNSLDHVEDLDRTVAEISRVTRPGGLFLLLVQVNHPPSLAEPHTLTSRVTDAFAPAFVCLDKALFAPLPSGLYDSVRRGGRLADSDHPNERGWLSAKLKRSA